MIPPEKPFSRLDIALSRFLAQRADLEKEEKTRFERIVMELSFGLNHGHSCIRVDNQTRSLLLDSGQVSELGGAPLILEKDRLYLHRYWQYEHRLAKHIARLADRKYPIADVDSTLDRYFQPLRQGADWQREAAKKALLRSLCIISGGPGTGKTTTVVKIIALLLEITGKALHIALAAPTGKAAMRLQEAIGQTKTSLPCTEMIKKRIPEGATTLHRLLGPMPPSPYFHHHSDNPLPHDLVIVDEASMVDLALMSKLVDSLKDNARLLLLGDKDQLASVESGAVLADLTTALPDHTVTLKISYRFNETIQAMAESINQQKSDAAWKIVKSPSIKNIEQMKEGLIDCIAQKYSGYLSLMKQRAEYPEIYQAFNGFRVLCANRRGINGVEEINRLVERRLIQLNLISPSGHWYPGRPVIVTQNHPTMHLYNGDIGICLPDGDKNSQLMTFFQSPDGGIKKYLPSRLPHCETGFSMTIHQSQGSEFDEILIALPETFNPVLTKELIYTAFTRAKKNITLAASQAIFVEALQHRVERFGGLADKIHKLVP